MERFLKTLNISQKEIKRILDSFFGFEKDGQRCKGLVDHETEEDFDKAFESMRTGLPKELLVWLNSTNGRLRSFPEMLKASCLKPESQ